MTHLTNGSTPYAKSSIFDENSLPASLCREHSTKPGTWGVVRIFAGQLSLTYIDASEHIVLTPQRPGLLEPNQPHFVEVMGPMQMQIEFYRQAPQIG